MATNVWVINASCHDYAPAESYGKLRFLSEGPMNKYNVTDMDRQFRKLLDKSTKDDFILLTSLSVMSAIACVIFAQLHGRLNILLYKGGGYVARTLVYNKEPTDEKADKLAD